jgi:hypothetical protein
MRSPPKVFRQQFESWREPDEEHPAETPAAGEILISASRSAVVFPPRAR